MKILVLGDIHGRTQWKDIYNKEKADLTIFLGDYVSTHDNISEDTQISNLKEILNLKKENSDKIILLRGNHDLQHLGYYWAECSGLFPRVQQYMMSIKDEFINNTQWIYQYNKIVFSHAGISVRWMQDNMILAIKDINNLPVNEIFGFTPCKLSDYTGISETQPCTWIRPWTLQECAVDGFTQIVGHTPVKEIIKIQDINKNDIWLCDNLPNQYLIIEDDEFIIKNV